MYQFSRCLTWLIQSLIKATFSFKYSKMNSFHFTNLVVIGWVYTVCAFVYFAVNCSTDFLFFEYIKNMS